MEQPQLPAPTEAPKPAEPEVLPPLSTEDQAWADKLVAKHFHIVVQRHGRQMFSLVMLSGQTSAALGKLMSHVRLLGSKYQREQAAAVQFLQWATNDLMTKVLQDNKISMEQFIACKTDVEQIGALSMSQPAANESRIILPH